MKGWWGMFVYELVIRAWLCWGDIESYIIINVESGWRRDLRHLIKNRMSFTVSQKTALMVGFECGEV